MSALPWPVGRLIGLLGYLAIRIEVQWKEVVRFLERNCMMLDDLVGAQDMFPSTSYLYGPRCCNTHVVSCQHMLHNFVTRKFNNICIMVVVSDIERTIKAFSKKAFPIGISSKRLSFCA